MQPEIYSQAERIAGGDPDLKQNILAMAFQNTQNAIARGKELCIGEQVNFMKFRAGNLKSGSRYDFGHANYKSSEDVYSSLDVPWLSSLASSATFFRSARRLRQRLHRKEIGR